MSKPLLVSLMTALMAGCIMHSRLADAPVGRVDLGRPATAEDIRPWEIDITPDGAGLPPGRRNDRIEGSRSDAAQCRPEC